MFSHSVESDSLRPHGLQPSRLFCPGSFSGKNSEELPFPNLDYVLVAMLLHTMFQKLQPVKLLLSPFYGYSSWRQLPCPGLHGWLQSRDEH